MQFEVVDIHHVLCIRVCTPHGRLRYIQDGDPKGKNVVIVDDLVQTGGTLFECGVALKNAGTVHSPQWD